jgi:EAL domain-containing protein (putative c-di-GMP-specific phosphodiesterase class I)
VLPAAFNPQLEASGNSRLLFDLVAAKALDAAAQWKTAGLDIPIAINASADDITSKGFADDVAAMIEAAGIAPENVILEVTETKLPTDFAEFLSTLTLLRTKGLNLSIDDFGCGTSTLQQIRQMPFSELKIDSQFVLNVAEDKDNQAIVTSCIDLAAKLGLRTPAEGIEREEDKSFLLANGCEIGQGYLVSRPAPFDDIIHFAAESWSAAP